MTKDVRKELEIPKQNETEEIKTTNDHLIDMGLEEYSEMELSALDSIETMYFKEFKSKQSPQVNN